MTFNEARTSQQTYLVTASVLLVSGISILLVIALKDLFSFTHQYGPVLIDQIIIWIYAHVFVVSWLWSLMPETGFGGTPAVLSPSGILALAFIGSSTLLFNNAARLRRWIGEVREMLAKEEMAASRRPPSSWQSIDARAGRDSHTTAQITNYYNHRPDNPKNTIIAAIITALAVIAAALLRNS
jgi:hypothetical protein